MKVGSDVLATLDRFALRAYDEKEQPELKLNGLSELQICTVVPSTWAYFYPLLATLKPSSCRTVLWKHLFVIHHSIMWVLYCMYG